MFRFASILFGLAVLAPRQAPQQPVFRSGVQIVEVDARVFDRDGTFITTLTRDDFEILEDGVPQQIVAMTLVGGDALTRQPASPTAQPSNPTVQPSNLPTTGRQTWIFFFDLNHLSPGSGFNRAREAVEQFIATRFGEGDLAGVVAGDKMVNGRLTTVRAELVQAVRGVKPDTDQRSLTIEMTREWPRFRDAEEALQVSRNNAQAIRAASTRACTDDPSSCQIADSAVRNKAQRIAALVQKATFNTFNALNGLTSGLAKMPGPKTIVFLSDGFVTSGVESTLRNIAGHTARAGARVYAIDVRGLNRGSNASLGDRAAADDASGAGAQFDAQEDGVNSLAIDTGGMMLRNENNVGRALDTIAADAGTYYVIGYHPANTAFDGKYRKIEIRVKKPGLKVRARQGYLALEPSKMLVPQPIKTPEAPPAATALTPVPPAAPAPPAATTPAPAAPAPAGAPVAAPAAAKNVLRLRATSDGPASDLAARGWKAYEAGDLESALPLLEQAASREDVRPWALYALGYTYVGTGRPRDAVAAWERVRSAAPDFMPVYLDLAAHYAQMSDDDKALAVLRDAERRSAADSEIQNGIGVLMVRRGALGSAIASFTRATELQPSDALSWLNLGRAYELRYDRLLRYDAQLLKWVGPEGDRMKAQQSYQRCVALGGPYASQASEALERMAWSR